MWKNLSIRSKLILTLLAVSILASLIVISIGYLVGVESIRTEVYARLTAVRNAKVFEIEEYFETETDIVEMLAASEATARAIQEFSSAFRQIEANDTINCTRDLEDYYASFLDSLSTTLEVRRDITSYYPTSAAACYLQYHYMSAPPDAVTQRADVENAGDGSDYSRVHAIQHPFFRTAMEKFGLYDVFLIDIQTKQIVYSVTKETDFATNLRSGPYRNSNLADLALRVERNADLQEAQFADFALYRPSYGAPAAFMGAPVFFRDELVGILAVQLSIDKINNIMNYGGEWVANGLGQTGETLLAGEDYLLRSEPRKYLENPAAYYDIMQAENTSEDALKMIRTVGPILATDMRDDNIVRALRGESNLVEMQGYAGTDVLSAFAPVDLPGGNRWALVTEINEAEAMQPVANFQNLNLAALAFIIALITILAMLVSRAFVRPLDRLTEGAEAVREGDTKVRIEKTTNDEMGRLTEAFNDMVVSIDGQKEEIRAQAEENDELLFSRFPDSIAERYRNGETNIVDRFEGVTTLSADLRGSHAFELMPPDQGWPIVQEISEKFNTAAEKLGMEVINAIPDGYLCVCGMNVPRLDNVRRVAILAVNMRSIISEINKKYDLKLKLNIGLSQGTVLAGILQDQTRNYAVWGPTIDVAQFLSYYEEQDVTLGTESMIHSLQGNFHFESPRRVRLQDGLEVTVGRLVDRVSTLSKSGYDLSDGIVTQAAKS